MEVIVAVLAILVVVLVVVLVVSLRRSPTINLNQASEYLTNLAEARLQAASQAGASDLDTKKQLIDQQIAAVNTELVKVGTLVHDIEKERVAKFSELSTQIKAMGEQAAKLTSTTNTIREALASTRVRGQWGDRIADDILRVAGFIEDVNYRRQATIEGVGSRPDYVFMLPKELLLNMDVKFPLDNYLKYLNALETSNKAEQESYQQAFIRDVRNRVKEITGREYINPEGGTVDYVLLFIPNESIFAYIYQTDPQLLDEALRNRVVCCSPFTLFAVLAVIRQAVENFSLQRDSDKILSYLGRFKVEWGKYMDILDTLGKRLNSTQKSYEQLIGPRRRKLERPLDHLNALLQQRGLDIAPDETTLLLHPEDEVSNERDENTN